MNKLLDDCFLHDRDRMKHGEAISLLQTRLTAIVETEIIPLRDAANRIASKNITAPRDIPFTDNAAVDGYAFAFDDHEPTGGYFPVITRVTAGRSGVVELPGFSAARIFTGAPMPEGADTIAMQEDCERHEQDGSQFVIIPSGLKRGANRRKAGEDVQKDKTIIQAGEALKPQDIAGIASTGQNEINVYKQLKIGLLSSGDEVLRPGEMFEAGAVYDANHFMLNALLTSLAIDVHDLGVCPDEHSKVQETLSDAADKYDVIISTGGASRGEEDHFINVVNELGSSHLWQLAVKPGRPMSFGQIGNTPCFTLPGNPVAAFICFLLYVRPSLIALAGGNWSDPKRYPLKADFDLTSKPDRREFLRGFTTTSEDGKLIIEKFPRDGSGIISGLREADGLIEIPEDCEQVSKGDTVTFLPFSELGIT